LQVNDEASSNAREETSGTAPVRALSMSRQHESQSAEADYQYQHHQCIGAAAEHLDQLGRHGEGRGAGENPGDESPAQQKRY
jgi:hypothetical protein